MVNTAGRVIRSDQFFPIARELSKIAEAYVSAGIKKSGCRAKPVMSEAAMISVATGGAR